jgi:protein arginine N-methyltransferase 1
MLKDTVRTRAYQQAITRNGHLFKDKVVLDVGCGTGILCMFAAQAGAKAVYGVDMAGIINQAREIVAKNGFADRITLIQGKIEEIELPVQHVDIIISEWMGYFLIYESMLDTVLYARDKWLVKDGLIFPDYAALKLTAIEDAEYRAEKIDFWDRVYGFNMNCIKELAILEPLVDTCDPKQVMANSTTLLEIDIYKVKKEELDFHCHFELNFKRADLMHAFVASFDIEFRCCHVPVKFSTGPLAEYTHWKQTVFYLQEPIQVTPQNRLKGEMKAKRNDKNPRDIDITIDYQIPGLTRLRTQEYRLR